MKSAVPKKKYKVPPRTAMEVFEMLPEGTLAEVINNTIFMSPAPSFLHQDVLGILHNKINMFVLNNKLGKCVAAPLDVYFDDKNALQPDMILLKMNIFLLLRKGK